MIYILAPTLREATYYIDLMVFSSEGSNISEESGY